MFRFSSFTVTLADIFCNKVLDGGSLSSYVVNEISPCLHLLKSIGQWQRAGVLSDKEDGLKGTALDDLRRLAGSAQCTIPQDKVYGLLGLLPRSICSKITIDYRRDEAELLSKFTAAIPLPNSTEAEALGMVHVI